MVRSFIVSYRAKKGCLVGGVKESQSCRYQRFKDARTRMQGILDANGDNAEAIVTTCQQAPEIFVHCGDVATAIGCLCPSCKKLLTIRDARKARPEA
jgi:hypothetical protein